jgi:hypothetical protein
MDGVGGRVVKRTIFVAIGEVNGNYPRLILDRDFETLTRKCEAAANMPLFWRTPANPFFNSMRKDLGCIAETKGKPDAYPEGLWAIYKKDIDD